MLRKLPLVALLLTPLASASPVYYTFQGVIDYTFSSEAFTLVHPPQPATYVFVVDREADGYIIEANGNVLPMVDTAQSDYYFADLVYGTLASPGIYQDHLQSRNYGRDSLTPYGFPKPTDIFTENQTLLRLASANIFEIEVGDVFNSSSWIDVRWTNPGQALGGSYFLVHQLQVVSISTSAPIVPVPAAIWLLSSALGVLAGGRASIR